jgi:hypothetical protein
VSKPKRGNGIATRAHVVVHVEDTITAELAGHDGCHYECPPQPRDEALALIGILWLLHVEGG